MYLNLLTHIDSVILLFLQRNCLYFALTARPHRRFIPRLRIHQRLHDFVSHYIFKAVIFIAVVLNCILLALLVGEVQVKYEEFEIVYDVTKDYILFSVKLQSNIKSDSEQC